LARLTTVDVTARRPLYSPASADDITILSAHHYEFLSHWRIEGADPSDAYDVLADEPNLPRWWPAVSLAADILEPGDERGLGRRVDLHMKGWLPYTLRWRYKVIEVTRPQRRVLQAEGDFVGVGIWSFEREGSATRVSFDWRLSVEKPLVKALSAAFKPVFEANHRWAMARGEESLRIELARRHARTAEELACIPSPPGPTFRYGRSKLAPA
jgi:hypothetical protein